MILSVGEILIDLFKSDSTTEVRIGGAPFNVAVAVKRSGGKVGFVGKVGDDDFGKFVINEVEKYNLDRVNVTTLDGHKTTVAEVSLDSNKERTFKFLRNDTADYQLTIEDIDFESFSPSILHLGTLMLGKEIGRKFASSLIDLATQKGVKISVDVNFRDDIFESKYQRNEVMKPFIEKAAFLKMGLDEIIDYTEQSTLENAVSSLSFKGVLFVTDGANGSHVFLGKESAYIPSTKVDAVDTTGAGDAFWGTALAGLDKLIETGSNLSIDNLAKITKVANKSGADAVTRLGAI